MCSEAWNGTLCTLLFCLLISPLLRLYSPLLLFTHDWKPNSSSYLYPDSTPALPLDHHHHHSTMLSWLDLHDSDLAPEWTKQPGFFNLFDIARVAFVWHWEIYFRNLHCAVNCNTWTSNFKTGTENSYLLSKFLFMLFRELCVELLWEILKCIDIYKAACKSYCRISWTNLRKSRIWEEMVWLIITVILLLGDLPVVFSGILLLTKTLSPFHSKLPQVQPLKLNIQHQWSLLGRYVDVKIRIIIMDNTKDEVCSYSNSST